MVSRVKIEPVLNSEGPLFRSYVFYLKPLSFDFSNRKKVSSKTKVEERQKLPVQDRNVIRHQVIVGR